MALSTYYNVEMKHTNTHNYKYKFTVVNDNKKYSVKVFSFNLKKFIVKLQVTTSLNKRILI